MKNVFNLIDINSFFNFVNDFTNDKINLKNIYNPFSNKEINIDTNYLEELKKLFDKLLMQEEYNTHLKAVKIDRLF